MSDLSKALAELGGDAPVPDEGELLIGDYLAALEVTRKKRRPKDEAFPLAERWARMRRERARKEAA